MSDPRKDNALEEAIEEIVTDPDSPDNSDTHEPPQTIDAEPEEER